MRLYRKKPVVVEVIRWTGDNLKEVIDFTGWHESASSKWTWEQYEKVVASEGLKIFTPEGPVMASVGDYIVRGVYGEVYPVKPDIFRETFSEMEDENERRTSND